MRYDLPLETQHTTFTARKCARKWLVGHIQIQQVAELTYWHQRVSRICAMNFLQLTARCYTHHRNLFAGFLSPFPEKNPWDKGVANFYGPHVVLDSPHTEPKHRRKLILAPTRENHPCWFMLISFTIGLRTEGTLHLQSTLALRRPLTCITNIHSLAYTTVAFNICSLCIYVFKLISVFIF